MQAQTINTHPTIRAPWLPLLLAALLVAALVLGAAVVTSRSEVTRAPATGQTIGPKDLAGPTAYPGFVPTGKVPDRMHQGVSNAARDDTDPVFVAPNGKPLP